MKISANHNSGLLDSSSQAIAKGRREISHDAGFSAGFEFNYRDFEFSGVNLRRYFNKIVIINPSSIHREMQMTSVRAVISAKELDLTTRSETFPSKLG